MDTEVLREFTERQIALFHERRLERIESLRLVEVLARKNPYLFRAKNILTAEQFIRALLEAHLVSQEETLFGTVLESLAVFVAEKVFGGRKSSAEGIDLELTRGNALHLISIKSGPNWGNSSQIARMRDNFRRARRILSTNSKRSTVVCVNGCCYGRTTNPDQGDYLKLCGKEFWELVSGREEFYIEIIQPLGHRAKEKNEAFQQSLSAVINKFCAQFLRDFCDADGRIVWEHLVRYTSGHELS